MGSCPVCGAVITEDFGLAECTKCQAQLIVHMDGRVEVQGEEPPPVADESEMPAQVFPPSQEDEFQDQVHLELGEEAPLALDNEPPPPPPEEPPPEEQPPPEENAFDGHEPVAHVDEPQVYRAPGAIDAASPNLSDLAAFANSEDSGGREGPLRYTLLIHGIDTADVREAFREALTDRKFMWDIEQILRGIRQGHVRIENVPPGKAYILINRLRNLPVQVRWEQNAIVQP